MNNLIYSENFDDVILGARIMIRNREFDTFQWKEYTGKNEVTTINLKIDVPSRRYRVKPDDDYYWYITTYPDQLNVWRFPKSTPQKEGELLLFGREPKELIDL